jgi:AraC family transcriptional activator of pobA
MKTIPVRKFESKRQELLLSGNFFILPLKELLAGKDIATHLHRHDYYHLLVVEKGRGDHAIDFVNYQVKDRTIFFLRPGQVHELKLKAASRGYLVEFKTDFFAATDPQAGHWMRKASVQNFCPVPSSGFKSIYSLFDLMYREFINKQEGYFEAIRAALQLFFIEFIRQGKSPKRLAMTASDYAQERLEDFLQLLETHIATDKQVAQYAERLHLSAYQLNAITKSKLGKTCSSVIDEQIILEAKRLLLATSGQVSNIAFDLGYEDVSYFIRFFKKHTGYSPEVFRTHFR